MKKLTHAGMLLGLLSSICSLAVHADGVAIIVNPSVAASSSTLNEVANLFLGKIKQLGDGTRLTPVDQVKGSAVRDEFYTKITKKGASQLNAYWSRMVFTGKGQPPRSLDADQAVKEMVSDDEDKIGYISSDAVDGTVKVLRGPGQIDEIFRRYADFAECLGTELITTGQQVLSVSEINFLLRRFYFLSNARPQVLLD